MAEATAHKPKPIQPGRPILAPNVQDTGATENALLLGIDLGTSRSSIVSINGARKTVESYVGYPKDPVSRKMLKADKIYGKAALDNRLALDLYRPLEHGVIKFHGGTGDKAEHQRACREAVAVDHDVFAGRAHRGERLEVLADLAAAIFGNNHGGGSG